MEDFSFINKKRYILEIIKVYILFDKKHKKKEYIIFLIYSFFFIFLNKSIAMLIFQILFDRSSK